MPLNTGRWAILACGVAATVSLGQGTVFFTNRAGTAEPPLDAPFIDCDGVTKLAGPDWLAQLYAGPTGTAESLLEPVGVPVEFRSGSQAGYFNGDIVAIPSVPPGAPAVAQVRVWEAAAGPRYEAAMAACKKYYRSEPLLVRATGGSSAPSTPPAYLAGLHSFVPLGGCPSFEGCVPFRCSIVRDGDDVVIDWPTVAGRSYALLRSESLTGGWQTILTQTATGDSMSVTISSEGAAAFFSGQRLD